MSSTTPEWLKEELIRVREENQMMKTLGTNQGFFRYYFEQLKHHRTQIECFNMVNDRYFDFFGEYRYSCYNSFRRQLKRSLAAIRAKKNS